MLNPGTKLGPYEIQTQIGAGGMGEVYRARDTRLNRDVALKVLPEAFAGDMQRMARFEREAKLLASLNHPNIAAIYGLEESGPIRALVMELVEGPTLADRIRSGTIPIDEALPIGRQVADAMEYAHDQNVIHRDLKPANIKVKEDGTVKVLDFGLAKAMSDNVTEGDMANSPTLSMAATRQGVILGTAAYMSPEQAKGRMLDRRTDVWAFGAVLFEMLTGKQPFHGEDVTELLAAIVMKEPELDALPGNVPPAVRTLVRRCLEKNLRRRMPHIAEARIIIEDVLSGAAQTEPAAGAIAPRLPLWRRAMPAAVTLCFGAVLAAGGVWLLIRPAPVAVVRTHIATSGGAALSIGGGDRDLAISPDGSHIVYSGNGQLLVRALDQIESMALTGLRDPRGVFFSPDGQWIGFTDETNTLKKVAIAGGPAVRICSLDGPSRGATWGPDGIILFATHNSAGLMRVSEAGGEPEALTLPDREAGEASHWWPELLPGGQAVLFTIMTTGGIANSQVAVLDLRTGTQKIVLRGGTHAHYAESGHLVYAADGTLRAVGFDLQRLETTGTPIPVVPEVLTSSFGGADFDVARNGTLVYVPGGPAATAHTLVWLDRQGREEAIQSPPRAYAYARLAPDGTRIALDIRDQESDIWIWDLTRETLTRLTFDPGLERYPVWTPDSRRIIFASEREGPSNLYWKAADNTGTVERLAQSANAQVPTTVSPDGARLVFEETTTNTDLWTLTMGQGRHAEPLVQSQFLKRNGEISPDERWLAYQSNESGQNEIYVRPFPDVNSGKWQVSAQGGTRPLWARSGQELFYVAPDAALMRVAVEQGQAPPNGPGGGPAWRAGAPKQLFDNTYAWMIAGFGARSYDISADGRRFLVTKPSAGEETSTPRNLIVVQNWFEELKQRVPTGTN